MALVVALVVALVMALAKLAAISATPKSLLASCVKVRLRTNAMDMRAGRHTLRHAGVPRRQKDAQSFGDR
jgi:hypothetical protein